ncbi:MAG: DUF1947 domain-containing protein [Thermoplasmatales archaeon]|nr:MAG: DUF1947 domain-containing protein [Thermoplasmatales archaeon]
MQNNKIKNRHILKKKEIKNIKSKLKKAFTEDFFDDESYLELGSFQDEKILFVDKEPCFMFYKDEIVFTLYGLNKYKPKNNFVIVDMGAVKFVTNGADVMAPGIINADKNINENDQIWICDEKHHKPLAVGMAIMNGEQMIKEKKGKAATVIHYVGDKLWIFFAKSL